MARGFYPLDGGWLPELSDKEFVKATLAAVMRRKTLIHGDLERGRFVCALGAFCRDVNKKGGARINGELADEIQAFNDSMPEVDPRTRRARVIRWLRAKLKAMA